MCAIVCFVLVCLFCVCVYAGADTSYAQGFKDCKQVFNGLGSTDALAQDVPLSQPS